MKLTVPEAARRAGRTQETIRRWIWSGRLPSEKVGNQHLVDQAALDALLGEPAPIESGAPADVAGPWGEWLKRASTLASRLGEAGVRLPPAADLVARSRRGR